MQMVFAARIWMQQFLIVREKEPSSAAAAVVATVYFKFDGHGPCFRDRIFIICSKNIFFLKEVLFYFQHF